MTQEIWQLWVIGIFFALQTVINYLKKCKGAEGQKSKIQIYEKAKKLVQPEYVIFVGWVPDHRKIERNKRVDKAAK